MDLNPVVKAKIKYYAENVLASRNKGIYLLSNEYLNSIGLNADNFSDITEILYDKKCFADELRFVWVRVSVDPYDEMQGDMEQEVSYKKLTVNNNKLKALVGKYCNDLRELPIIEITKLNLVAQQIRALFAGDVISKIVGNLYESSESDFYITKVSYNLNLNDFFIYFAYCKDNILFQAISEFLNPIYFDINSKTSQQKFYNYLNDILKSNISDEEYKEWTVISSKYILGIKDISIQPLDYYFYIYENEEVHHKDKGSLKTSHGAQQKPTSYYSLLNKMVKNHPNGCEHEKINKIFNNTKVSTINNALAKNYNGLWRKLSLKNQTDDNSFVKIISVDKSSKTITFNNKVQNSTK